MLQKLGKKRHTVALTLILLLTAFLTCWRIWEEGSGNAYYTAAVSGMLTSWHNFFFASFDAGGFISVDKPALGLWLQAAFGLALGVHGWSLILPEALCAVGSVAVLHHIVRRGAGPAAGLLAAAALALTPIFAAVARTNNLDSSLVFTLLLAAWALISAAEAGSLGRLLVSMALVGIGFNIKMLQAWMVLPALMLAYLAAAKAPLKKRLGHLAAGAAVALAVSLAWAAAVDLTPAADRPYVGGSATNSVLELAVDYNGIQRVLPGGTPGGAPGGGPGMPGGGAGGFGGRGPGMNEGGQAGVLRLFNESMAGQASWLIPAAVAGMLALAASLIRRRGGRTAALHLALWAGWVLPMFAYFSVAGFFHRYYLSLLAPGLAALFGFGAAELWALYKQGGWRSAFLPLSIAATAAVQCIILSRYDGWPRVLRTGLCALAAACVLMLALCPLLWRGRCPARARAFAAVGLLALLAAPAAWSYTPIAYGSQAALPIAGPELQGGGAAPGQPGGGFRGGSPPGGTQGSGLLEFLSGHDGGEKFLLAVPDANTAAPIILATGRAVMAVGGFLGTDGALSVSRLEQYVANGELRYFLAGGRGGPEQSAVLEWVRSHGAAVPASQWGGASPGGGFDAGGTLYDLKPGAQKQ